MKEVQRHFITPAFVILQGRFAHAQPCHLTIGSLVHWLIGSLAQPCWLSACADIARGHWLIGSLAHWLIGAALLASACAVFARCHLLIGSLPHWLIGAGLIGAGLIGSLALIGAGLIGSLALAWPHWPGLIGSLPHWLIGAGLIWHWPHLLIGSLALASLAHWLIGAHSMSLNEPHWLIC